MTFDANWLDASSMFLGVANLVGQKFRKTIHWLDWNGLYPELMNGAAVPPVLLLVAGAWFSDLLVYLQQASRPTLFFAGLASLWALLANVWGYRPPQV